MKNRLHPCAEPGCHELTAETHCPKHAAEKDRAITRVGRAIYRSRRWRGLRRTVLKEQPWCAVPDCQNLSKDVDHVIPVEELLEAGDDPFDLANLQGLCKKHHSQKTAREIWRRKS